ncbi:MAG: hypothetical protein E7585_08390 [Ruminococcaceae bacterium]|nr:hypothetical protein [Oscillospiraceae bacterium]
MKENNDIAKFRNRYLKNFDVMFQQYSDSERNLIDILLKSQESDPPDGYFYDIPNSTLYIFEQFEFDCSSNNSSGSMLRKNTNYVSKKISKEISRCALDTYNSTNIIRQGVSHKQGETITYNIGQDGEKYRDNYIRNFETIFKNHLKKLEIYKQKCKEIIKDNPRKVIITFLVEDVTMFGTYYKNGDIKGDPVDLLETQQFYHIFKDSNIDYVIFGASNIETLSIFGKDRLKSVDPEKMIDLMTKEFYIIPVGFLITSAQKSREGLS